MTVPAESPRRERLNRRKSTVTRGSDWISRRRPHPRLPTQSLPSQRHPGPPQSAQERKCFLLRRWCPHPRRLPRLPRSQANLHTRGPGQMQTSVARTLPEVLAARRAAVQTLQFRSTEKYRPGTLNTKDLLEMLRILFQCLLCQMVTLSQESHR